MACGDALIQGLVFDRARIAGCEQVYNGQSVSCPGGSTIAITRWWEPPTNCGKANVRSGHQHSERPKS